MIGAGPDRRPWLLELQHLVVDISQDALRLSQPRRSTRSSASAFCQHRLLAPCCGDSARLRLAMGFVTPLAGRIIPPFQLALAPRCFPAQGFS